MRLSVRSLSRPNILLQAYGLREIGTGIGLLFSSNPRPWLWGRVAGDIVDVASVATTADRTRPVKLGIASIALLGVGLLDIYSALKARPVHRANSIYVYGDRSGFAHPASHMRGAALSWKKNRPRMQAAE